VTLGRVGTEKYRFKPLRYVRGLHFRGECVGQSTATRVIAAQFHASLCHSLDDKIASFLQRDSITFPGRDQRLSRADP